MNDRILDFLTKGLNLEARQTIFEKLGNISPMTIQRILEKPDDYPTFRRMGYTEKSIEAIQAKIVPRFEDLNNYMHEHERNGFFSDPTDAYRSSREYVHLLKQREKDEIEQMMGSSYEDYVPKVYVRKKPQVTQSVTPKQGPSLDD